MLVAHPVPGKQKSVDLCNAFIAGTPKDAQGHVFYGVVDGNLDAWKKAQKSGLPYYWIDGSYFDCVRGQQYRVTKNAIQVQGARNLDSDGARFKRLGLTLKPWSENPQGYWLLIEQSEVFMRLIAKEPHWWARTILELPPGSVVKTREWDPNKIKLQTTLLKDLAGARLLVTHTSTAAVTATIEGVPVVVSKMHALYDMQPADRQHFLNVLADNQFSTDEMKDGSAYRWLNR